MHRTTRYQGRWGGGYVGEFRSGQYRHRHATFGTQSAHTAFAAELSGVTGRAAAELKIRHAQVTLNGSVSRGTRPREGVLHGLQTSLASYRWPDLLRCTVYTIAIFALNQSLKLRKKIG